tara:strand:+ start:890 stop:1126 length:237 start_codon:yes stop_codon:yes gene_type:complete
MRLKNVPTNRDRQELDKWWHLFSQLRAADQYKVGNQFGIPDGHHKGQRTASGAAYYCGVTDAQLDDGLAHDIGDVPGE